MVGYCVQESTFSLARSQSYINADQYEKDIKPMYTLLVISGFLYLMGRLSRSTRKPSDFISSSKGSAKNLRRKSSTSSILRQIFHPLRNVKFSLPHFKY
mmetsp:Transcript_6895/g.15851  ORF Transcript_6895/g.15851 Transcript_6895/m.15851 type:complete len:99 (+) Transcript_6895:582-878(+)